MPLHVSRHRDQVEANEELGGVCNKRESPRAAKRAKKVSSPERAVPTSYKVGDKVDIWYEEEEGDGQWYAGAVTRLLSAGMRVTFDMDGSGTIIRTEEFAGRLKPRKTKTAPILGGAASAAAAASTQREPRRSPML